MRVLHINYSDVMGGAARAASRINRALNKASVVDSEMLVRVCTGDAATVTEYMPQRSPLARIKRVLKQYSEARGEKTWDDFSSLHSPYLSRADKWTDLLKSVDIYKYDIVNLHWLGSDTLSVEEVGEIEQPVVWTMHDMWPFCGAEHYVTDLLDARFRVGYQKDNRAKGECGPDMNRSVWERKRAAWSKRINAVGPSQWICQCARQSILFRDQPVEHIPNPIDVTFWRPQEQALARNILGIPVDKKVVLFGSVGGESDPRKGADLMHAALQHLVVQCKKEIHLVVFGQSEPDDMRPLPYPTTYLGPIDDDLHMATVYSSADVMVVSSRQDNQPLTAVEAQACGVPVVAFKVGGLPEIVEHQVTGAIAQPFDSADLGDCIAWVLADSSRCKTLGESARAKVVRELSEEVVAEKYVALYEQAIKLAGVR